MYKEQRTDLVDILLLNTGILKDLLDGLHRLPEKVQVQLFKLGPGQGLGEVVPALEALNLDPRALLGGQRPLGLLDLPLQLSERTKVTRDVGAGLLLVELGEILDDTVVEIFTTEMSVTGGGEDLEDPVVDGEEGDIESSSTEIVNDDLRFATLLVETVGDGGSGGFVDDTEDLETGDGTGILGGLTLGVVEVWQRKRSQYEYQNDETVKNVQAGTVTTA